MRFSRKCWPGGLRAVEAYRKSGRAVEACLIKLIGENQIELVPNSYHDEDEQERECEATFRHFSGAYLLYARHTNEEQLDVQIPTRLNFHQTKEMLLSSLKDLDGLLNPVFSTKPVNVPVAISDD